MSESDQELRARLERGYDAFNRRDYDEVIEHLRPVPEFEFHPASAAGAMYGSDAFRGWMEPDAFSSQQLEVSAVKIIGNMVLVVHEVTARGAASGIEVELQIWGIWTLDEAGRMTSLQLFPAAEKARALAIAGIAEGDLAD